MINYKLNFIHLCDDANLSQEGKINIIGIFDVINVINLPGTLLKAVLAANFEVTDDSKVKCKVDIKVNKVGSSESVVNIPTLDLSIPSKIAGEPRKVGIILQLGNVQFNEEGLYNVVLIVDNKEIGKAKFVVKLRKLKGEMN